MIGGADSSLRPAFYCKPTACLRADADLGARPPTHAILQIFVADLNLTDPHLTCVLSVRKRQCMLWVRYWSSIKRDSGSGKVLRSTITYMKSGLSPDVYRRSCAPIQTPQTLYFVLGASPPNYSKALDSSVIGKKVQLDWVQLSRQKGVARTVGPCELLSGH